MSSSVPSSLATPPCYTTFPFSSFSTYEPGHGAYCSPFTYEGKSLQLLMLPHGFTLRGASSCKSQVYLYLALVSEHTNLQLKYEISLLKRDGSQFNVQRGQAHFLDKNNVLYNWKYSISRAYLLDPANELLVNDTITVQCLISPSATFQPQGGRQSASQLSSNCLSSSLKSLLESGKHADIKVHVSGRQFPAHKAFLAARSPVFAAMFENDTLEAANGTVTIEDFDPEVIELLLLFIYTAQTEQMDKYAFELFKAADKYQLESLKKLCESYLLESITTETVSRYLQLAHLHQAEHLQARCIAYFLENATQVMDTEAWKEVMANTELATLLFREMAKKIKK